MKTSTRGDFQANLEEYFYSVCATSEPLLVSCEGGKNVVVVPQAEWGSNQETFYIKSTPEIMESIRRGESDYEEGRFYSAVSVREVKDLADSLA